MFVPASATLGLRFVAPSVGLGVGGFEGFVLPTTADLVARP